MAVFVLLLPICLPPGDILVYFPICKHKQVAYFINVLTIPEQVPGRKQPDFSAQDTEIEILANKNCNPSLVNLCSSSFASKYFDLSFLHVKGFHFPQDLFLQLLLKLLSDLPERYVEAWNI